MTAHYRWETTLDERRRADPGIDDPARGAAARKIRDARDIELLSLRGIDIAGEETSLPWFRVGQPSRRQLTLERFEHSKAISSMSKLMAEQSAMV